MKRVKKPDPVLPITDIEDEVKSDQAPGATKRKTPTMDKPVQEEVTAEAERDDNKPAIRRGRAIAPTRAVVNPVEAPMTPDTLRPSKKAPQKKARKDSPQPKRTGGKGLQNKF
jgi:hypothetical protein